MQSPCGFSTLLLDSQVYHQLSSVQAAMGLRLEGLPVQVTKFGQSQN